MMAGQGDGKPYPYNVTTDTHNGVHSWLLEYIHKCKSGEILIGHELMQMLDILLTHFDNPEISVDFTESAKRIKFIQEKCRHFEAPFAGKPFILDLFQKAYTEALYSFKIYDEEVGRLVRLFQESLFLVARKNGKTPFIAALCLAEFFCGPLGIKILCSSNDYEQAGLMFDAINNMREESPSLDKLTRKNIKGIYFGNPKKPKKKGKFSYRNKASIRKISAKTGAKEGRNIGVGAVDEVHELKDNSSIMPIRQALSTQDEPLYFELTTEGLVNDGYLDERLKDARKVLDGELERPRCLIWLYTQDSETEVWQDEKTWVKSNPGAGTIKKWSYLRQMVEEARSSKSTRALVLSKDFNIKQIIGATAWLEPEDISKAIEQEIKIEDFRNCFAIGGTDLSKTGDLTSARILLMKPGSSKKYFFQQYFIPESKLEKLPKEDLEKFKEWIKAGHITVCDGNENDFRLVTAWYYKLYKDYNIRVYKTGYDKWSAIYWVKEMEEYGFDCVRVNQEYGAMSQPMKLAEDDFKSGLIICGQNPVDKWCLENTAFAMNNKGDIMPIKIQGKEDKKIDGAVTIIIAYKIYIDNRPEFLELVKRAA